MSVICFVCNLPILSYQVSRTWEHPGDERGFYHEECLRCDTCGLTLTGANILKAKRCLNKFLCDLHYADVISMAEGADFLKTLREFKGQSLGYAVARRKSSTTLVFPLPPQACQESVCPLYPHNAMPTPGYWIECSLHKPEAGSSSPVTAAATTTIMITAPLSSPQAADSTVTYSTMTTMTTTMTITEFVDDGDGVDGVLRPQTTSSLDTPPEETTTTTVGLSSTVAVDDTGASEPIANDVVSNNCFGLKMPVLSLEETFKRHGTFELASFEQETYEKYFYASEHWNYFGSDDDLGPVILSLKQETFNNRDQFRIMVRTASYSVHGLVPASCIAANRYDREAIVKCVGDDIGINPPLKLGQLPSTPDELLKLDQVFIKSELKVGVAYVKEGQTLEEQILDNSDHSALFEDFLLLLGDKVRLKGFDKYKGGLDTVHDLTGTHSIYSLWRNIEIMFHVSTLLPYEPHDPQKLQRKRHIGNDIVCVVFLDGHDTEFSPACIKSHFLHTFIVVQPNQPEDTNISISYRVSVVSRDEVGAYKPYLWQQSIFEKGPMFREWLLTKIVNGERASYSAPKFARMQDRTRCQMLEDIVTNLQNHAETGQIPKPYRRGSWRPIGHMRPSSPLLDSVRDLFEGYDQLSKDFLKAFITTNMLCDVVFHVGPGKDKTKHYAVRSLLAVRSRVFQEMLYGISNRIGSVQCTQDVVSKALANTKMAKSNFLQVPDVNEPARHKSAPSSPMVMRAFSRIGSSLSARLDRSFFKKQDSQSSDENENLRRWQSDCDCKDKNDTRPHPALMMPRLSVCADMQKVDRHKLCQTEFSVIEFDSDTFETLLEYLHTGACPLTCRSIPGLICAAEHYDLPELLQACFHHARQFLRIEVVSAMLGSLENYYWRYTSASELVNMLLQYVETRADQLFDYGDFYELSESMVQMVMSRELVVPEIRKFEMMYKWACSKVRRSTCRDTQLEFRCTMERLTMDLKLYKISPTDLIKVVLPTKAIRNERILETLMHQANSGMYRIQSSYLQECRRTLQREQQDALGGFYQVLQGTGPSHFYQRTHQQPLHGGHGQLHRQETVQGYGVFCEQQPHSIETQQQHRRDSVQATMGPGPSRDPAAGTSSSMSSTGGGGVSTAEVNSSGGVGRDRAGSTTSSSSSSGSSFFSLLGLQRRDTVKKRAEKALRRSKDVKGSGKKKHK